MACRISSGSLESLPILGGAHPSARVTGQTSYASCSDVSQFPCHLLSHTRLPVSLGKLHILHVQV